MVTNTTKKHVKGDRSKSAQTPFIDFLIGIKKGVTIFTYDGRRINAIMMAHDNHVINYGAYGQPKFMQIINKSAISFIRPMEEAEEKQIRNRKKNRQQRRTKKKIFNVATH